MGVAEMTDLNYVLLTYTYIHISTIDDVDTYRLTAAKPCIHVRIYRVHLLARSYEHHPLQAISASNTLHMPYSAKFSRCRLHSYFIHGG